MDKNSAATGEAKEDSLKLNERCGNVYENKGPLLETCDLSRNVYENKASYPNDGGM
jgi:hypothetical protein